MESYEEQQRRVRQAAKQFAESAQEFAAALVAMAGAPIVQPRADRPSPHHLGSWGRRSAIIESQEVSIEGIASMSLDRTPSPSRPRSWRSVVIGEGKGDQKVPTHPSDEQRNRLCVRCFRRWRGCVKGDKNIPTCVYPGGPRQFKCKYCSEQRGECTGVSKKPLSIEN